MSTKTQPDVYCTLFSDAIRSVYMSPDKQHTLKVIVDYAVSQYNSIDHKDTPDRIVFTRSVSMTPIRFLEFTVRLLVKAADVRGHGLTNEDITEALNARLQYKIEISNYIKNMPTT